MKNSQIDNNLALSVLVVNHGNDVKTFKLKCNIEPQARSRAVSGRFATKSFCYKSFRYIMKATQGEVVKLFICVTKLKTASKYADVHLIFDD